MGFQNDRYFYLSGVISFTLFGLILAVIGFKFTFTPDIQQYGMTQSNTVTVSLDFSPVPPINKSSESETVSEPIKPLPEPVPVEEKQEAMKPAEKVPDVADLFASVKSPKRSEEHTESLKQIKALDAIQEQVQAIRPTERFADKFKSVNVVRGGSTGPVVDKYYAKILGIIDQNFNPPLGTAGNSATVVIVIDAEGRLKSFRILRYSGSDMFNAAVDRLKQKTSAERFPAHPEGQECELKFELIKSVQGSK